MLKCSSVCFPRCAVAFFNMKHFQVKHKVRMSPENAYATLSSSLMPRDRLLRQSASGRGAGRVLVLDQKQKVKGVYIPVCCLPHPATIPGGDGSLGVAVEDYLKVIEPLSTQPADKDAATNLPTVLAVVSHPQGVSYGIFYANGRPALPAVHTDLSSESSPSIVKVQNSATALDAGTLPVQQFMASSLMPSMDYFLSLLDKNADAIAKCSTLYWILRDGKDSLSLPSLRRCETDAQREEFVTEGDVAAAVLNRPHDTPHAVSFKDQRWMQLQDMFFDHENVRNLYTRDPATKLRTVDPEGLQSILSSGTLLLDYVPQSAREAAFNAPDAA